MMSASCTPAQVLWVDDHPENNQSEVLLLRGLGIGVTSVRCTRQALDQLRCRTFAAIVSDMGRWEGSEEGYVLLDAVRGMGMTTPLFFYAGSRDPDLVAQSVSRGANGCTNEKRALIEMIRRAAEAPIGGLHDR